jgi:hypothetical protein
VWARELERGGNSYCKRPVCKAVLRKRACRLSCECAVTSAVVWAGSLDVRRLVPENRMDLWPVYVIPLPLTLSNMLPLDSQAMPCRFSALWLETFSMAASAAPRRYSVDA